MSKKKKVKAPVYEEFQGNEYTDRERENVGTYGDWVNQNWKSLATAPTAEDFSDIVNKAYNTTWNDYLEQYNKQANALASRNYNRFGGLGSTPSLYTEDMLNKQYNDLASRLSSQMYMNADQLAGNQFNRNLTSLGTVQGLYDSAGNNITNLVDIPNWQIRNTNKQAKYVADVQNAQNSGFNWGNSLLSGGTGAVTGFINGGPAGAIAGGLGGLVTGGFSNQNTGGIGTLATPDSAGISWLNNKLTNNTNNIANISTPTTRRTYSGYVGF